MTRIKSRIGSFIVTIAMLAFVLPTSIVSAQTAPAKTLADAIVKTSNAKSMESNGNLNLKLKGEGLSNSEQQHFAMASKILNNLQVDFNAKTSQKSNGKGLRQYVKTTANVGGVPYSGEIWSDMKLKGEKPAAKIIVKSSDLFKKILPAQYTNKYMVVDSKQTKGMPNMNYGEMLSKNKELQNLMLTLTEKYSSQLNLEHASITKDGNVYKVKIDDATFKNIIRKVVNLAAKDKDAQNLIKGYMLKEVKNSGASTKEINSANIQIDQMFTKLQSQKFLDMFNKNMDRLEDVKILGDKGIEISYTIDKNGYITNTKGDIELVANVANIRKVLGETASANISKGICTANIHFEVNNININKKINIKLPKLNSKNSFNHSELINKLPTKVKKVCKNTKTINKVKCVKVKDIICGAKTKYTYSKGNATIAANGKTITLTKGKSCVNVNVKTVNDVCKVMNINFK